MSKGFAWFGFFNIFDFALITIIDIADQDDNGDLFKLYNYFNKADGSGFVGYFLTFIAYTFMTLINVYLFYDHIVFIHHESKISDIYLRISGKGRDYFIPEDNELSYRLLKHIYVQGEVNQNRILANKIDIWDSTTKEEFVGKVLHFYKFESSKSLESGQAFYSNMYG